MQLSLAIGKKGQNVRLAAKLTGWKIEIKSEEEKRKEVEAQLETLATDSAPAPAAQEPATTDIDEEVASTGSESAPVEVSVGDEAKAES